MVREDGFWIRSALAVYITGFGIGAFNHARDFLAWGWRPYNWGPPLLEVFWTSLFVMDVAVVALIARGWRRPALSLAAGIMITDVGVNTFAWRILHIDAFATAVPLQTAFLGFVLGSMPFLWNARASPAHRRMK
ncbi:hypothetical protein GCM10022268_30710 [Sphingomonas cynarae]|uniref:Uncharacterized protein n=1 Tax=Sphingomonas cynarae TaxID=930197 RepID=A0ABP7EK39_9SPHN